MRLERDHIGADVAHGGAGGRRENLLCRIPISRLRVGRARRLFPFPGAGGRRVGFIGLCRE